MSRLFSRTGLSNLPQSLPEMVISFAAMLTDIATYDFGAMKRTSWTGKPWNAQIDGGYVCSIDLGE